MDGAGRAYIEKERRVQIFSGETCGIETIWKTQAQMGG